MVPSIKQLRIVNCVLCGVALLATVVRLWIRFHRRKLWWDDFWVVLAALCTIVLIAANFYHTVDPESLSKTTKVAIYWLCIQFYYAVTWTSRLSILYTVILITPGKARQLLQCCAFLFGVCWVVLFAQVFWVCLAESTWMDEPIPQCKLGNNVAVAQTITFIVTDAILVVAPIHLIWGVRLPRSTKVRLISVFAATILTTIASLCYIYAVLRIGGIAEELAATVHDGISLLVANLSIIMSFFVGYFSATGSSSERPGVSSIEFNAGTGVSGFVPTIGTERAVPSAAHVHLRMNVERDRHRDSGKLSLSDIELESSDLDVRRGNGSDAKGELATVRGKDSYELNIFQPGPDVKVQVEH